MATAQLQYRVNGGALHEDSIEVSAGDEISLTAADFSGWATARWEVVAKPPDVVTLTGWTYDSATQRFYYLANSGATGPVPPTITLPSDWGKWTFRLTVRDGSGTAIVSEDLSVSILSDNGLQDLAVGEKSQFGGARNWPGPFQDNLRVLDQWMTAGGPIAVATVPFVLNGVDPSGLLTSSVNVQALSATLALASTTVEPLAVRINPSTNSTIVDVFSLRRSTSHASHGANGLGARFYVELEDSAGNHDRAGTLDWDYTDATSTSEDARFTVQLQTAGALGAALTLTGTGLRVHAYGAGRALFDSSGNITSTAISAGEVQTALAAVASSVSVNNQKITNLAPATVSSDAVTWGQAQALALGLDVKDSVFAATTANITLSGEQTIDGQAVTAGKRVLVKNQSTGTQNGYYLCAVGSWTRTTDLAAGVSAAGAFCFVEQGTANGDKGFLCTSDAGADVVGTDGIAFTTFTGGGADTNAYYLVNASSGTNPNDVPIQALAGTLAFNRAAGAPVTLANTVATSGAKVQVLSLRRLTGGAGANNDGGYVSFTIPDSGSSETEAARLGWSWQAVTGTYGSVSLAVRDNLGLTERYTWASNGKFSATNLAATALSSAGLVTNDASGNLVSNNSSILSVGAVTNVSNARDINDLALTLGFVCDAEPPIYASRIDASTDTVLAALQVHRGSSDTPAANIGAAIELLVDNTENIPVPAGWIGARLSTATDSAEVGELVLYARTGGSLVLGATLTAAGAWTTVGAMKSDAGFDSATATALPIGASSTSLTFGSNATAAHVDSRLATAGSARWYVNNVLQASLGAASLTWGETVTTPVFGQDARTTDAATTTTVLAGQAPWASATGTNRNSGSVRARIPTPAAGGAEGFFYVEMSGADVMRVGRPSGTFEAEVRFSPAATVIRPATISGSTLELFSAGVRLSGDTIRLQDVGQTPRLTWAVTSTAITATHDAGLATITETWTQDASAAGGTWTWNGQRGASGFAGGSLAFNVGDGGTQGTNAPGNFDIGLGTAVSSVTGKVQLKNAAGSVLGDMGQVSGPYFRVANSATTSSGLLLKAVAGNVQIESVAAIGLESSGGALIVNVVDKAEFYDSSTLMLTQNFISGGTAGQVYGSTATSVAHSQSQRSGTGTNPGAPTSLAAQQGQNQTGGADNNAGGNFTIASGAAGTGGSGAAASPGEVLLKTGGASGTTQLSVSTARAAFTNRVEAPRFVGSPSAPTSSANAVTISLDAQNPGHTTTEATTVTISGGTEGQTGTILFSQGASGYTVTMPTNGVGVEYDSELLLLGGGTYAPAIVDPTAFTRTLLSYRVLANGKAYIFARSVNTIP